MKAQFAPVAPIQVLQALQDIRILGHYHLLLAHHTVEHPDAFRKLWADYTNATSNRKYGAAVIMDNSIVELGGAVDDLMIREAVDICKRPLQNKHEVIPVLPDVMGDGAGTRALSAEAYSRWQDDHMSGDGYMLVTQGTDFEDFTKTVDYFFCSQKAQFGYYDRIRWVGIPRKLVSSIGGRADAIRYVQTVAPRVRIHLLGFSDDVVDDLFCVRMPGVSGIDSAVPLRYPGFFTPTANAGPRPQDWFNRAAFDPNMGTNLLNVRNWVSGSAGY